MLSAFNREPLLLCHRDLKRLFFKKHKFFILLAFLLPSFDCLSQTTITGTIKNNAGAPLPAVSVQVKNSSKTGVTTNDSGRYSIRVLPEDKILVFSSVGHKT